ncbi:MAG: hypothetical protein Kow0063_16970 [Anaerolineae bacterium]
MAMIPFYRPYFDHSEILAAVRPGAGRDEFELAVANRMGARYGVAFAYGRSGLVASLRALGLNQAEVVMPAYMCVVMAQAVIASGNWPVFVDINLTDYNMDLDGLPKAITPQTKAVVAAHLYGYPIDVDAIRALVRDDQIVIIEDCAQKLHSASDGAPRLRGDIGLCSFGANKELSTVQGGVIVTNSPELYKRIKSYRDREMSLSSSKTRLGRWARLLASYLVFQKPVYGLLSRFGMVGLDNRLTEDSDFEAGRLPGDYRSTLTDFQGRIGLAQLRKLETVVAKRRTLAEFYTRELRDVPGVVVPPIIPGANYAYYSLRVPRRDELNFRWRMLAMGVAVDETYEYALPFLKPYRSFARTQYPRALEAARQVINLPIYPSLSLSDAGYVVQCIRCVLEGRSRRG